MKNDPLYHGKDRYCAGNFFFILSQTQTNHKICLQIERKN